MEAIGARFRVVTPMQITVGFYGYCCRPILLRQEVGMVGIEALENPMLGST